MGERTNVRDGEGIAAFADTLQLCRRDSIIACEQIAQLLQQIDDYLLRLAPQYWQRQERRAELRLQEASSELSRKRQVVRTTDERSCEVERKAVAKAKARLELCEDRRRMIRLLAEQFDRQRLAVVAAVRKLQDDGDGGLHHATDELRKLYDLVQRYASEG